MFKVVRLLYKITRETKAIKLKRTGYFNSIIWHGTKRKYSIYEPIEIIQENCIKNGSSLEGRLESVRRILNSRTKLPIPVIPEYGVFMVPTMSARNEHCVWFSYYHIKHYKKKGKMTRVKLSNDIGLYVKVSANQFDLQVKRTSQVIANLLRPMF